MTAVAGTIRPMADVLKPKELRTLPDEELVRLIVERTNLTEPEAWIALEVMRGGPPSGTRYV